MRLLKYHNLMRIWRTCRFPSYAMIFFCYSASNNTAACATTSEAFVFSLHNNEGLEPFKSMVTDSSDQKQFTGISPRAWHLAEASICLLETPHTEATATQGLAPRTQFHLEFRTRSQSWLELTLSHLMSWKRFILLFKSTKDAFSINLRSYVIFISTF